MSEETEYLNSENAEQEAACGIDEFPLPHKPTMRVRVKQLSVGVLRRLSRAMSKGTDSEKHAAEMDFIRQSIVNADGSPVFGDEQRLKALKNSNGPLFGSLMDVIVEANRKRKPDDEEIDDLEKN